ncbi:V-set domain-containing T-cell activation inhibitor 1-like isoform X2 [Antennarius striatus]|uniref:V-set domain-containing T-cell activation inhibitor 1-like isoform X2 n=1 Tax=Antennarius striatus TaxID=241820 RepID=UPI0035B208A6
MERLTLVCLWLVSCCGMTSADRSEPLKVEEGTEVILPCSIRNNLESLLFDWKKDDKEVFMYEDGFHYNNGRGGQDPQFRGRVWHFQEELKHGNASIIIRNTKVSDSGNYTCVFPRLHPRETFHIQLAVDPILKDRTDENIPGAAPKPYVNTLDDNKDSSLLQCSVQRSSPKPRVEWWDDAGNVLPAQEPQITERDGLYDIILQTTVTKTGRYRCVATQEKIHHQIKSDEIDVFISGAAPEPVVKILNETSDWSLLQCSVRRSSPQPRVEWWDGAGNVLPAQEQVTSRDGRYDIILQTTVTKTGRYRCVATQEVLNDQTSAETYVHINEAGPQKEFSGRDVVISVAATFLVTVLVGGVCVLLYVRWRFKNTQNPGGSQKQTDNCL